MSIFKILIYDGESPYLNYRLKIPRSQGHDGSIPSSGTNKIVGWPFGQPFFFAFRKGVKSS